MSKKEKLFEHILKVNKPQNEPQRNLEEIKKEVESFKENTSVEIPNIPLLQFDKKILRVILYSIQQLWGILTVK
ncbi:hypothetical protein [Aggregatibacter aphrophilus]|uniref:hypothetical protein n=1 Tax=Aggregatibacter aphrophilus TaxID=732 RepID=UPI000D6DF90E|nr:hypothetical protein [Aggregatibacter aphrophilus]